jgi:GT2 family glycosyltransferase
VDTERDGEEDPSVCAVVVTCNRKELLVQCLEHLHNQSRPLDEILVIDNASEDGTAAELTCFDGIVVERLPTNIGGAGGFKHGLSLAHRRGFDWIWLLDDDTFPDQDCLEAMLKGALRAPRPPSLLSSAVHWRDSTLHPMNRPWLRWNRRGEFATTAGDGLVLIRAATFVSTMIHRGAVDRHGLPYAHYFLWLDDIEYTGRILRQETGYLIPESRVVHWTPTAYNTVSDTRNRFYFKVRNQLWLLRGDSFAGLERFTYGLSLFRGIFTYLRTSEPRMHALRVVALGLRHGLGREPSD